MKTKQYRLEKNDWIKNSNLDLNPQLCLLFGSRKTIENNVAKLEDLRAKNPECAFVISSTAGNILGDSLFDDTIIATFVEFEKTSIQVNNFELGKESNFELGKKIANSFDKKNLVNVLILSTMGVNAGDILNGINQVLDSEITVSGGVAGDNTLFEKTLVGFNDNISDAQIVAVGFYGNNLKVTHGSKGGWDTFGPIRKITKCLGNVLYEIDNKPVLDLYKEYLGEKAKELPASGLLFPFAIIDDQTNEPVVRGIQNIDEDSNSIILYGDVVEGQSIQLMRANFDNLIQGAGMSANEAIDDGNSMPQLAILISCVARRLVLGQLVEEELTEVKSIFGPETAICGFYSYSELSPLVGEGACKLHNQTMTITTFSEI